MAGFEMPGNNAERRSFGTGDLLMFIGSGLCTVALLFILIACFKHELFSEAWAVGLGVMIMFLASIMVIVAAGLSFSSERWLLVVYGWVALVVLMMLCHVSVLAFSGLGMGSAAPGADFFILLGALLSGAGAFMAQRRIGQWPQAGAAGGSGGVEAQLTALKSMRDRGLISEDDFSQKRQELLQKL